MICEECSGDGWNLRVIKKDGEVTTERVTCNYCHGKGYIVQTNEEWLRSASTEQLAELLDQLTDPKVGYLEGHWERWLKEVHK